MLDLGLLLLIPFLGAFVVLPLSAIWARRISFLISLAPFVMLAAGNNGWIGQDYKAAWLPSLHIYFHLAIDPVSYLFLLLTAAIIPLSLLAVQEEGEEASSLFYSLLLLTEAFLAAFFMAKDLLFFVLFWEAMLIPLYFVILRWGAGDRFSTAIRFIIYMATGSFLLIAGVLALYMASSTLDLGELAHAAPTVAFPGLILFIFLLAFAVKTPLFPFHGWLPDTYTLAPYAGSIVLSALLSKAGIYGVIRIGYGIFPELMHAWSPWLLYFCLGGVLYGGIAAWTQTDFKRLIAYSSLSHVNFILAGLFAFSLPALEGAVLQSVNHGVTVTALFFAADWLQKRIGTTLFSSGGGLALEFPHLTWVVFIFVLSAVALPGTGSFVGEFMILFGLYGQSKVMAALFALTVILTVIYMLYWMQALFFGKPVSLPRTGQDLTAKERAISLPLVVLIWTIGLYPAFLLDPLKTLVFP
jgi:NADH-quinone oxidoreductase subunit M